AWVVDRVADLVASGAVAVLGNHDSAIAGTPREHLNADARRAIEWTRKRLDERQLRFLAQLPLKVEEGPWLFVHANGWAPTEFEYILSPFEAGRSMNAVRSRITFCGHVHEQQLYHIGITQRVEHFKPFPGVEIPLAPARRWLVLPGSVGQPRDGDPAACYALFDELNHLLTYWRGARVLQNTGAQGLGAAAPRGAA